MPFYTDPAHFPLSVRTLWGNRPCLSDTVGMSDSAVLLAEDMVLKIEALSPESENEYRILDWLQGRLPVPELYARETADTESGVLQYLLMGRIGGVMACHRTMMTRPAVVTSLLAEALRRMWELDTTGCPTVHTLDRKLALAAARVEGGLVDVEDCNPATFGKGGFRDPAHLLQWLEDNRPPEEPVFSHGDFCLPNLLLENDRIRGYIDLGRAGLADRWQDIALCWRSLGSNARGEYGGPGYAGFGDTSLFDALGLAPDWDMVRYYVLLDELF